MPYIVFMGVVLLLLGWFRFHSRSPTSLPTAPNPVGSAAAHQAKLLPPVLVSVSFLPEAKVAADSGHLDVADHIADLGELAMNNDADSLNMILESLTNADPQIRVAALEAAIQFGSPDAIPSLQDAMARVELPQEKVNLQAAIDFLKLPSFAQNITNQPVTVAR